MKKTNIPWAPYVPDNWIIERGKRVLDLKKRPVRDNDEVITCFRDGEVILRSLRRTEGFTMSDKEIGYQGINEGDIVIHGMDGFAGAMGVSKSTGKGSPVLVVCTPKNNHNSRYLIFYLRTLAYNNVFLALSTGIRERSCDLKWNKISELDFLLPPIEEQKAIAEIIDRKCGEVDEMVSLQEQVIEELKAYKQSVITEAVTKGLNPTAPMKPTNIDWIGQIPTHWGICQINALAMLQSGNSLKTEDITDNVELYPVYGGNGIRGYYKDYLLDGRYVLIGRQGALCGNIKVTREKFWVTEHAVICYPKHDFNTSWFAYMLESMNLNQYSLSAAQPGLAIDRIKRQILVLPPLSEQREIAVFLDRKCADIDALIALKQQKIEDLKQYKKSLIYEYVTGKK